MKTMSARITCGCGRPITMEEIIEVGKPDGEPAGGARSLVFIGYYCFACKEIGQQLVERRQWNACYLAQYLEV